MRSSRSTGRGFQRICDPGGYGAAATARNMEPSVHKGRVTAGLYVGGEGGERAMGADHVITDREVLRKHPPDILLTNYKMLDFLMVRPEDGKLLWADGFTVGPGP